MTKYKIFFVWEHEKEENWLNKMSAKGYKLVHCNGFLYKFEQCAKGEYTFRLVLMESLVKDHADYFHFLEDTGVEHVCQFRNWAYFCKRSADGAFEIFSDIDTKVRHYESIVRLPYIISFILIPVMISFIWNFVDGGSVVWLFLGLLYALVWTSALCGALRISAEIRRLKKERFFKE